MKVAAAAGSRPAAQERDSKVRSVHVTHARRCPGDHLPVGGARGTTEKHPNVAVSYKLAASQLADADIGTCVIRGHRLLCKADARRRGNGLGQDRTAEDLAT